MTLQQAELPTVAVAEPANVAEFVAEWAQRRPAATAAIEQATGRRISFGELGRNVAAIAAGLRARGICNGMRAVLAIKPGIEFVELVYAMFHAGAVPVVLDPGMGRKNLLACIGEARAEALVAAAQAETVRARLQLERVARLGAAQAATTQEREAATAAADAAAAQLRAAERGLDEARAMASHFQLRAPAAGVVLLRHADPGDLALPGRPLLVLYQPGQLRFAAAVPEALAAALKPGQELSVECGGSARPARVTRVLPGVDPATGTVSVHLVPPDPAGWRPGQLGRVLLPVGERPTLLLAARAVRRTGQVEWVELVRDGHLVPVTVRSGRAHGDQLEILTGLRAGERVQLP